ncbi:MAG: RIP metalloprotease RseP [Proteobacteria bacterium]|nr:RIP metalloprotease RseP [Pseudomonadota bacterium]
MAFLGDLPSIVLPFLITITVLIFIHELGHYLVARWNNVRVEVFSIGFGREIFGWNDSRGTHWKFCWIPIGGYVKFFGDMGVTSGLGEEDDSLTPQERDVAFHHKRLGQRAAIVVAGPLANFVLAIVLFAGLFSIVGQPFTPPVVSTVTPGSAAASAGLEPGDRIVRVRGSKIARFEDIQRIVQIRPGEEMALVILRDGAEHTLSVTPRLVVEEDRFGNTIRFGRLGIRSTAIEFVKRDPITAVWYGFRATYEIVGQTFVALQQIVSGRRGAGELAGPLGIAQMSKDVATISLLASIQFAAFLSVSLGLINLFPIPVLDGGHLLFYGFEALRGKPLSRKAQEYGLRFGLLLIFGLLLLTTFNDLNRLDLFGFVSGLFS